MNYLSYLFLFLSVVISSNPVLSQVDVPEKAISYIEKQLSKSQSKLSTDNFKLIDGHINKNSGDTHLYFIQTYQGIEIHNAISKMAIDKNGKIVHFNCNFIKHSKVKSISPKLKPCQAVTKVASHFGKRMNPTLDIK